MEIDRLDVDGIEVGERHRDLNPERVKALAESIKEIGLLQPIAVYFEPGEDGIGDRAILVSGYHRLEAVRSLGEDFIDAHMVTMGELDRELAEIDENLIRNELSAAERDDHLARRQEIFEARHRQSGKKSSTLGGKGNVGFARDTAEKTGMTKQTINRSVARSNALAPAVKDAIRQTEIAKKGVELDALASIPADQQMEVVNCAQETGQSVRQVIGQGKTEREKAWDSLYGAWRRAPEEVRREFFETVLSEWHESAA